MTRTVALSEFMPYGAPELQSVARCYLARALLVSTALGVLAFAATGLAQLLMPAGRFAPPPVVVIIGPQPAPASLGTVVPPPPVVPTAPRHAAAGVAVPVPDAQAAPEATIASTDELRTAQPGVGTGDRTVVIEQPIPPETLPRPDEYIYTDELPVPVHSVSPEYPTIAREAGVSGMVLARLLVGRDGRVLEVQID